MVEETYPCYSMLTINRHWSRLGGMMNHVIHGSRFGEWAGMHVIMPLLARAFWMKSKLCPGQGREFIKLMEDANRTYCQPGEYRKLKYDIISAFILYSIGPAEYFMYGFKGKTQRERDSYVSDMELFTACTAKMTRATFEKLWDKWGFYCMTKDYFKRDACVICNTEDLASFTDFAAKHPRCFLKPNARAYGAGCRILDIGPDVGKTFAELQKEGPWLVEELIVQAEATAAWNASSVNTIRLCSFRVEGHGSRVSHAFIRVGRAGSVVDNGGAGGIFASIAPETGILCTDGADESGHTYAVHPDSGKPFKGEQIPRWEELLGICREVHATLPPEFHYVGFDFALTDAGWVLGEGNWGQYVAQQVTLGRGLRREFEELMGVTAK